MDEPLVTITTEATAVRIQALCSAIDYAKLANPNATLADVLAVAADVEAWLVRPTEPDTRTAADVE